MEDYLRKLAQKRLEVDANKQAVDALVSYIAANPGVQTHDLIRKSMELGHDPRSLISQALGSVKVDKTGASLSQPLEEILNQVYETDNTPGSRYVVDPLNVKSKKGLEVSKALDGAYGVADAYKDKGSSIAIPDMFAVEDAKDETNKLRRVATGGHELKHGQDYLIRPNLDMSQPSSFKPGHHFGDIYETSELIREARDLPQDVKAINQVTKSSEKYGLKAVPFKRLASISPILAKAGLATAGGLVSLASEASDTEETGDAPEQAAFLRERDELVNRANNYKDASPIEKQVFDKMYDEMDRGQAFNARRDALNRIKNGR